MSTLRNVFWVLSLGVIVAYLFFLALGAYAVDEVLPLSIAVAVFALLWVVHGVLQARGRPDPRLTRARERRGF